MIIRSKKDHRIVVVDRASELGVVYESPEQQRPLSDEDKALIREMFSGPNDPRLPDDIKALPIGRREDFVSEFNFNFFWYDKSEDDEYDENVSLDINRVNFALRMAAKRIADKDPKDEEPEAATESVCEMRIRENSPDPVALEGFAKESAGGYTGEVTVIQVGWSLNGHYWSAEAVNQISAACANQVVGYFNHGDTYGRDPRDWGIVTESGRVDGRKVKSRVHVFNYPDGDFLRERIEYAKANKANGLFGLSIDALVRFQDDVESEGRTGRKITELVQLNSVDIVMVPAAGGRFLESQQSTKESVMDVKTLKEQHPDTATLLLEEGRQAAAAAFQAEQEQWQAKEQELAQLKDELAKAKAELDAYQAAEAKAKEAAEAAARAKEWSEKVDAMLAELPAEKVTDGFKKILLDLGPEKVELVAEMIAERKLTQIGSVVTGEGTGNAGLVAPKEGAPTAEFDEEARLKLFTENLR